MAILAAYALDAALATVSWHPVRRPLARTGVMVAVVAVFVAWPTFDAVMHDIREANRSTRVLAREWMIDNLPADSRIVEEWYTAPLVGTDFDVTQHPSLVAGGGVDQYRRNGVEIIVASSWNYDRYYREAERYSGAVAFYNSLFDEGNLLKAFIPSDTRGEPVIRVYSIQSQPP